MQEMELREYWMIIRRRWLIVISMPILALILGVLLSFYVITPQYEADTTLLVNQKPNANQSLQYDTVLANQALVNTYNAIIKSASIEAAVIQELNLPYTITQLNKMISVSSPTQSEVIDVKVLAPSHSQAVGIANSLAHVFQSRAQTLMDVENVQIIDQASINSNPVPVKPNKQLNLVITFVFGLIVGVGLGVLLEYIDNRIRTEDDVQKYLGIPVLGVIAEQK